VDRTAPEVAAIIIENGRNFVPDQKLTMTEVFLALHRGIVNVS
jgi:hypothetical protein